MPNDIVVQSDKNGGKVHLSADRVYDLNKNKTQDVINAEFEPLMQLDSEVAIVIDGRSCTLGAVSGQYVILQNSTIAGKSDGLYTVATGKTIPIGATNVTADMLANPIPRGGLNSLKNTLNSVETSTNALEGAIAYVQDGDTASRTYIAGQFVYLKNHPTLAEGLYTVNSGGIPQSTSVTGHLTADTSGGLNSINDMKANKTEVLTLGVKDGATYPANTSLATLPNGVYLIQPSNDSQGYPSRYFPVLTVKFNADRAFQIQLTESYIRYRVVNNGTWTPSWVSK